MTLNNSANFQANLHCFSSHTHKPNSLRKFNTFLLLMCFSGLDAEFCHISLFYYMRYWFGILTLCIAFLVSTLQHRTSNWFILDTILSL